MTKVIKKHSLEELQRYSIELAEKCNDDWETLVSTAIELRHLKDNTNIALGIIASKTAIKYGEDSIGKLATDCSIAKQTLYAYRKVAETIRDILENSPSGENWREKIGHLGYTHLRIISATEEPEKWIEEAIAKDYTAEQLALAVKGKLGEPEKKEEPTITCPKCGFSWSKGVKIV